MKIDFHGKERSLLESKLILLGLKTHFISLNLNEEEKENYFEYQDSTKKTFWKPLNEREFLIHKLDSAIEIAKILEDRKYCENHGHKRKIKIPFVSKKDNIEKIYCERCGTYYETGAYGQEI